MYSNLFKIRSFFRFQLLGLLSFRAKPKPGVHILNGHFLSLKDDESPDIFEKLLNGLKNKGVNLIDFTNAVELITTENYDKKNCFVAFTFDDGFEECFTKIKPVLDRFNLKAAFFINPNFIDGSLDYKVNFTENIVLVNKNPMSWEQIIILSNEGHTIGAHTLDHVNLNSDDREMLIHQINGAKKVIEDKLNTPCDHFAFPFGQLSHISALGVEISNKYFRYVYSQSNYRNYYSFDRKVINRRHFECDWPLNHVIYFLKRKSN